VIAVSLVVLLGLSGWSVEVNTLSTPKEGSPGSFVTHVFGVTNDSSNPETYSLEFAAPTGWGILGAPTSIALQPNEEGTLFVTATIPPGAVAGEYNLDLTVTSQSDPVDYGVTSGITNVTPMSEIELLAPTGASITPGGSITYEFVLVNRGNVQDSFTLAATSSRGLTVSLSHTTVDLAPHEKLTFTVQLDIAVGINPGQDMLTVIARSSLFDGVDTDALVYTSVLPPPPDAVGGTVMEELPARIRLSIDKNVMTGVFDSQLTFSTSGQILDGYFSSFFSLLDPLGPSLAEISSFSILYRRQPATFSIGNVSQQLTDLIRLSCTGGSLVIDAEYYDLFMIGGGNNDETRFAGYFALGPDVANAGIGYMGIRDPLSVSQSIWTATAHAEPLEDWTLTLEGSLGLDGQLTSRAFFFNTTLDSSGYFFNGSAFSVGTHFPGQRADSAGIEVSQRLRLSTLSLSASLSHEWDNVIRDPLKPTRIQDNLGFNLTATPLEDGPTLASTIDFSWDRYADLSLKSDLTTLLSVSLTETSGVFPYSLSGKVLEQIDHVLGSHVQTTTYSEGVGLAIDAFYLFLQLTQKQSIDVVTDTQLSSSSDVSIRFRPETALHEASITFRNSRDDFDFSGSFSIHFTDDLDITFDGSISWDRHDATNISFGWGIAFNANVTIPLPFMVTKGRIEGRAFIDRDGDGRYGLNDEPAGATVVGTGQSEVSTNADGYFRFPPLYPGSYTISPDQLPVDAAAGAPIPPVTVIAGETIWVDIPLAHVVVISGDVFEDIDKDGARDSDEGGFAQMRVVMRSDVDGSMVDAYTNLAGVFTIPNLLPGTYTVSIDENSLPDRFEFTTADEETIVIGALAPLPVSFGGFIREREAVITFQPPTADFLFEPEEPVAEMPILFDGTYSFDFDGIIVSYAWDFDGDGITDSTDSIVQYIFQQPGTIDVALTVLDDSGNEDTIIHTVTVSGEATIEPDVSFQPPVADFSYMPAQPLTGETVLFDGTVSSDFDGTIMTYAWDFDGNGEIDAAESIASHVFPSPGTYNVSLTVTDNAGNADTVTYSVAIIGAPQEPLAPPLTRHLPIATFQISPTKPEAGGVITFNGTSSLDLDGLVESFSWDFDGDGIPDSTFPITEYTFASVGLHDVTLIVTDNDGNMDSVTMTIEVVAQSPASAGVIPPIADFAYLPAEPEAGDIILFNATLSADPDGHIASYAWDFDEDGRTDSVAAIVDYSFPEDGVYDVSLTVADDSGSTDTLTLQIVVGLGTSVPPATPSTLLPPIADFGYSPVDPQTGSLVLFNGTLSTDPDGEIAAYAWDFNGDGIIDSTAAIAEHTFLIEGTHDVSLTVTDNSGTTDTFTLQVAVDSGEAPEQPATSLPPLADFEYSPVEPIAGKPVLFNGLLSTDIDGDIVAYAWDFNDDAIIDSTASFTEHVFPSSGTFNVSLTVIDDSGNSDSFIRAILVDVDSSAPISPPSSFQPPVADFSYMPAQPMAGELVMFNGTTSWDFDGDIVSYSWDFNNDGSPDANTAVAEYFFPSPGTITVSLTVTDDSGASDTLSIPIEVE